MSYEELEKMRPCDYREEHILEKEPLPKQRCCKLSYKTVKDVCRCSKLNKEVTLNDGSPCWTCPYSNNKRGK